MSNTLSNNKEPAPSVSSPCHSGVNGGGGGNHGHQPQNPPAFSQHRGPRRDKENQPTGRRSPSPSRSSPLLVRRAIPTAPPTAGGRGSQHEWESLAAPSSPQEEFQARQRYHHLVSDHAPAPSFKDFARLLAAKAPCVNWVAKYNAALFTPGLCTGMSTKTAMALTTLVSHYGWGVGTFNILLIFGKHSFVDSLLVHRFSHYPFAYAPTEVPCRPLGFLNFSGFPFRTAPSLHTVRTRPLPVHAADVEMAMAHFAAGDEPDVIYALLTHFIFDDDEVGLNTVRAVHRATCDVRTLQVIQQLRPKLLADTKITTALCDGVVVSRKVELVEFVLELSRNSPWHETNVSAAIKLAAHMGVGLPSCGTWGRQIAQVLEEAGGVFPSIDDRLCLEVDQGRLGNVKHLLRRGASATKGLGAVCPHFSPATVLGILKELPDHGADFCANPTPLENALLFNRNEEIAFFVLDEYIRCGLYVRLLWHPLWHELPSGMLLLKYCCATAPAMCPKRVKASLQRCCGVSSVVGLALGCIVVCYWAVAKLWAAEEPQVQATA